MTPTNLQGKKLLPHTAAATTIATMATNKGAMSGRAGAITNAKQQTICYMFRKTTTKKEVSTSPSTGQEGVFEIWQVRSQ